MSTLPKKTFHFPLSTFHLKLKHGFSLIELLVVIGIIGILISFGAASWSNAQQKARDGQRKSNLKSVQQALETYFQQNGKYPSASSGRLACNITGDSSALAWGTEFSCDENGMAAPPKITYMTKIPLDPKNTATNIFCYESSSAYTYSLNANLENASDPEKLAVTVSCNGGNYNYSVINP